MADNNLEQLLQAAKELEGDAKEREQEAKRLKYQAEADDLVQVFEQYDPVQKGRATWKKEMDDLGAWAARTLAESESEEWTINHLRGPFRERDITTEEFGILSENDNTNCWSPGVGVEPITSEQVDVVMEEGLGIVKIEDLLGASPEKPRHDETINRNENPGSNSPDTEFNPDQTAARQFVMGIKREAKKAKEGVEVVASVDHGVKQDHSGIRKMADLKALMLHTLEQLSYTDRYRQMLREKIQGSRSIQFLSEQFVGMHRKMSKQIEIQNLQRDRPQEERPRTRVGRPLANGTLSHSDTVGEWRLLVGEMSPRSPSQRSVVRAKDLPQVTRHAVALDGYCHKNGTHWLDKKGRVTLCATHEPHVSVMERQMTDLSEIRIRLLSDPHNKVESWGEDDDLRQLTFVNILPDRNALAENQKTRGLQVIHTFAGKPQPHSIDMERLLGPDEIRIPGIEPRVIRKILFAPGLPPLKVQDGAEPKVVSPYCQKKGKGNWKYKPLNESRKRKPEKMTIVTTEPKDRSVSYVTWTNDEGTEPGSSWRASQVKTEELDESTQ